MTKLKPDTPGRALRVVQLAGHIDGVTNADIQRVFSLTLAAAQTLMRYAEKCHGLQRVRIAGSRLRLFGSKEAARFWLEKRTPDAIRARRHDEATEAARQRAAAEQARREQLERDWHMRSAQKGRKAASKRVDLALAEAQSAKLTASLTRRSPTALPASAKRAPPKPRWQEQQPVITSETKVVVVPRAAGPATRVDVMADELPGVPGWRGGPHIRAGALDFKRHQRTSGTGNGSGA